MAAKFFTGLPLDGPDPECVLGHGESLLARCASRRVAAAVGRPLAAAAPRVPIEPCDEIRSPWPAWRVSS